MGKIEEAGIAILNSDKTDFKTQLIRRGREEHIFIKGKIHQEDIAILNIYVPNNRPPKFITTAITLCRPSHSDNGWLQYPSLANR